MVTYKEGLVVELSTVDRLAAGAGAVGEVAPLEHKLYTIINERRKEYTKIAHDTTEQKNTKCASDDQQMIVPMMASMTASMQAQGRCPFETATLSVLYNKDIPP